MLISTIKLPKSLLPFRLIVLALFYTLSSNAQNAEQRSEIIKFGIGVKAVATSELLSGAATTYALQGVNFSYESKVSRGIDAMVRIKLKNRFSLQSGITSVRRSYNYNISTDTLAFGGSLIQTSFQMPLTGLLQVQISDKMRIGTEAGFVAEMFPGDVASGDDEHFALVYVRKRLNSALKASALTNYELNDGGRIELGFTYHRMLGRMGSFYLDYEGVENTISGKSDLQGHFFSVNMAYFFK
ncbi:MAG: hypothetical protein ACPGLV_00550 [Bacteroidia bacterium]